MVDSSGDDESSTGAAPRGGVYSLFVERFVRERQVHAKR